MTLKPFRSNSHRGIIAAFALVLSACGGQDGQAGLDGTPGTPGADGVDGADGRDGSDGLDGVNGAPGERGPRGLTGPRGPQGNPGSDGADGADGSDGAPGLPALPTGARALLPLSTHKSGLFDEGAAEIVKYHPATHHVFVVNAASGKVTVLELDRAGVLHEVDELDVGADIAGGFVAGAANSVDVHGDVLAVAIDSNPVNQPGRVAFYNAGTLAYLGSAVVGALPDMVKFTPDGNRLLVANEGEQIRDGSNRILTDAEGSVSIIDVSGSLTSPPVTAVTFAAWNGRIEELRARGVRIPRLDASFYAPGAVDTTLTVAKDLEPEYIAISGDSATAFVSLQENNAFAVIDIATGSVRDILPLGLKDFSRGLPRVTNYTLPTTELPELGTTPGGQTLRLGGFSGLWYEASESTASRRVFYVIPDRGPNATHSDINAAHAGLERPHVIPDYTASIFQLILENGALSLGDEIPLVRQDGITPITGKPNHEQLDPEEFPVDTQGNPLAFDALGGDLEGILIDPTDGSFWLVDEYRPAIYNFAADGVLIERFVPAGTAAVAGEAVGTFGSETLPAAYATRVANRGFEAVALDTERQILYAFIQSPMANPTAATANSSAVIRVLGIDADKNNATFGEPVEEFVYLLEGASHRSSKVDKIGDAVFAGRGRFHVIERDSSFDALGKKFIYTMDLKGATNVLGQSYGQSLESMTPDALHAAGIRPVNKVKVLNLPSIGYTPGDKAEGLALLEDGSLAVLNDNDFGLAANVIPGNGSVVLATSNTDIVLGHIQFTRPNGLDASDQDGAINITQWPVYGMYMPDGLTAYVTGGQTYYISANEGDSRDYDTARLRSLGNAGFDATVFPNRSALRENATGIGRLGISLLDGDLDGDGALEQIHTLGGRSLSIWDRYGNLVYDSGNLLEQITALAHPAHFNSNHTSVSFDSRSDDKGPEPEDVVVGDIGGRKYAFLGLERIGGIVVLDVTNPSVPVFVDYVNHRDFSGIGNPAYGLGGDLGAEGLCFIPASQSPTGTPLLLVANEVSGTTTAFRVNL